jgi:peroxiredoxin
VSLDGVLAQGDALLYFSMGPGCAGCFVQIPEIEAALAERNIVLVPVMVDPAPMVAAEAARFGIEKPILIDSDRRVSESYGMLGIYGHGNRPSHSFALVDRGGRIVWVRHYAEMFIPVEQLLSDLDAAA